MTGDLTSPGRIVGSIMPTPEGQPFACNTADEYADALMSIDTVVDLTLANAGLSKRERTARIEKIPPHIRKRIPQKMIDDMLAGSIPSEGFGLAGGAGAGKTFAIAGIFRAATEAATVRRAAARLEAGGGSPMTKSPLRWLSWPETVNELRTVSMRDGGLDVARSMVAAACVSPILMLDDIGSERIKGTYADDWAATMLDLIVDDRNRNMRPTWYTTNLGLEAFVRRYGQRLFSRLCGENRMISLGESDDLRMRDDA